MNLLPFFLTVLIDLLVQRLEVRNLHRAAVHQCHLVDTVGTPLAVIHSLLPGHTYDRIERECRVLEIVVLIWVVVRQILTPYGVIRTSLIHQLRSYCTEYKLHPVEVFVPVQVRDLVLVHVEVAGRHRTGLVVTRSGQKLILLSYRKRTSLDLHHSYRICISHTLLGLKISSLRIEIAPSRRVTYTGIQLALLACRNTQNDHSDQQIL